MWRPLATVTFPSGHQGLSAFHQLREFRIRHEHEWNDINPHQGKTAIGRALMDQKANSIADLAAVLQRQEMAAEEQEKVAEQERQKSVEVIVDAKKRLGEIQARKAELRPKWDEDASAREEYKRLKNEKMKIRKRLGKPVAWKALVNEYDVLNDATPPAKKGLGRRRGRKAIPNLTMDGLRIEWSDLQDAEFAETWPKSVMHDTMPRGENRYRHASPPPSEVPSAEPKIEAAQKEKERQLEGTPSVAELTESPQPSQPTQSRLDRLIVRLRDGAQ